MSKDNNNEVFHKTNINWFPGHMQKTKRQIGELLPYFASTTGTGTATNSAAKFGDDIGKKFIDEKVDGVLLVST